MMLEGITFVAQRIVNDESHFSWQEQYLVMLEGNLGCSAHCFSYVPKINHESHLSWQAQDLMMLEGNRCLLGCK